MTLIEEWRAKAYNTNTSKEELKTFWNYYFDVEKKVYEKLLENPDEAVTGTVQELADKYEINLMHMVGFLDGIDESLKTPNPLETMAADTKVSLEFDKERLYKNMVAADAEWLYNIPAWKNIFSEEKLAELYKEQKRSGIIKKDKKIYPNDPCPCGSGKKYKKCCGKA